MAIAFYTLLVMVEVVASDCFSKVCCQLSRHQRSIYLDTFISFEAIESEVKVFSQSVSILIVYHPPPSSGNNLSTELFMNEFSSLLESYITKTGSLVIAGDFNFHIDDTTDTAVAHFLSLLESFDLQQHVRSYTHRAGHTLDLLIARDVEYILNGISVDDSSEISDHYTVLIFVLLSLIGKGSVFVGEN